MKHVILEMNVIIDMRKLVNVEMTGTVLEINANFITNIKHSEEKHLLLLALLLEARILALLF